MSHPDPLHDPMDAVEGERIMSQPENPVPYPTMTENPDVDAVDLTKDWRSFVVRVVVEREIEVGAAMSVYKDEASAIADAVNTATDIAKKQVERGGKEWGKHVRVRSVRQKGDE